MRPGRTAYRALSPGLVMSLIQARSTMRGIPHTPSLRQTTSARVGSGVCHAACLLPSRTSMSRGCAPGDSTAAVRWLGMSNEMSDDQVKESFQIISITVSWGVADLLRGGTRGRRPHDSRHRRGDREGRSWRVELANGKSHRHPGVRTTLGTGLSQTLMERGYARSVRPRIDPGARPHSGLRSYLTR